MSAPHTRLFLADGSWVELGSVLARAGEGTIFGLVHHAEMAAKIFHPELPNLAEKVAKVAAMVDTVLPGAVQSDGFVVLAWPQKVLYRAGAAVGFLMPRINAAQAVEIHSLSNPSARANPLPSAPQWTTGASWAHLVTAAANLCLAVDVVHHVDAVIGDFQERNILVADTMRVTLVDCDSMQFTDRDARQFLSPLGRPEFTAPELAAVDLRKFARDKTSDLFALAVHIHLLILAGNHPFLRGVWTGPDEQPSALKLASQGDWAGGPGSRLHSHPLAPPVSFLPTEIQGLFVRAFTDGARDPNARPSAEEWRQALSRIEIIACETRPEHQLPAGADFCPWCDIEAARRARKVPGAGARPDQVAMPPLSSRIPAPPPPAAPTVIGSPALLSASRGSGNKWAILGGAAALLVIAVVVAIGLIAMSDRATDDRRDATTASEYIPPPDEAWAYPPPVVPISPSSTMPRPLPVPQTWRLTIVGTCDEGGTCGVKQRDAPYTAAGRLVSDDLQDGNTVTVVCQTIGDVRTNDGRGASSVWYRLANGAYVASVYMDTTPAGVPPC